MQETMSCNETYYYFPHYFCQTNLILYSISYKNIAAESEEVAIKELNFYRLDAWKNLYDSKIKTVTKFHQKKQSFLLSDL